jgi:hypothetical protein
MHSIGTHTSSKSLRFFLSKAGQIKLHKIRLRSTLKTELYAKSFPPFDFEAPLCESGVFRSPWSRMWQFARLIVLHQVDVMGTCCNLLQVFSYLFLMIVLRYQYRIAHLCVSPSSWIVLLSWKNDLVQYALNYGEKTKLKQFNQIRTNFFVHFDQ